MARINGTMRIQGIQTLFLGCLLVGMTGCLDKWFGGKSADETNDVEMVSADAPATTNVAEETAAKEPAGEGQASAAEAQVPKEGDPVVAPPAPSAPPPMTQAEIEALQREVENLRSMEVERKEELQALKAQQAASEQAQAEALAAVKQAKESEEKAQKEVASLKAEIERLNHLDYNEYARLVELSKATPEAGVKEWPVFIEKFPSSPLIKEAREQLRETERALRQKQKQGPFQKGNIFSDRAPIVR